jgi:hypothetical protein
MEITIRPAQAKDIAALGVFDTRIPQIQNWTSAGTCWVAKCDDVIAVMVFLTTTSSNPGLLKCL